MPASERRLWRCRHDHILGEVKLIVVGARRVRALMLYEQSVALGNLPEDLPVLRGRVIGGMDAIRCTYPGCQAIRDWIIGEDAMDALSEGRQHG